MTSELRYVVEGRPVSWRRPNYVRGRVMTDATQRKAKHAHRWAALAAGAKPQQVDDRGLYEVEVVAYYPDRRQGDADRILGVPLDALEGLVYRTDRQVRAVRCERRVDRERPRLEVTVRRVETAGEAE